MGVGAARGARVVGVEAERSPAISTALAAGEITPIEVGDTLADGLAGNLEPGSVTFELVRDHVDAVVGVSEPEIAEAMRFLARAHGIVAEGAGAAAVAGVLAGRVSTGRWWSSSPGATSRCRGSRRSWRTAGIEARRRVGRLERPRR